MSTVPMSTHVEWRAVTENAAYEVSEDGRVRRRAGHKLATRWPVNMVRARKIWAHVP